jgi:cobalt-zinc-cadmium efflux system membrane fusion protein
MFAAFVLSACGSSTPPPGAASAPAAAPDATYFTVPADQLPHLKLLPVRKTTWSATVHTTGTVDWDNDHTTQAITQVSGPITRILVDTGSRVKVGDPLLTVASSDMTTAVSTYRKAKNRFDLAQRTLTRSRDLLEHKAISQKDLESAEADANDAATDLQSSLQTLKIFGVAQDDIADAERQGTAIRPDMTMRAPLAGTIVQKMVTPGQFIQAGMTTAFTISNTATVWVQGHVYDKDLTAIHAGDKVDLSHAPFPQMFHGTLSYIGDLIDPATRTTSVRIVTENMNGELKKDMFLDVVIHDKTSREVIIVPTAAVLHDEENFPFVYAQAGPGKFAKRLVKAGDQQGDDTEITGGLEPGDMVVSDGSVFLQFANTYQ